MDCVTLALPVCIRTTCQLKLVSWLLVDFPSSFVPKLCIFLRLFVSSFTSSHQTFFRELPLDASKSKRFHHFLKQETVQEEEGFAWTTRSVARELIPYGVLSQ